MTSGRRRGCLIAVEGIDGAGKSSLARALAGGLRRKGWSVRLRREPADATLGRLAQRVGVADPWTAAIYFTVDRHLARPGLERDLRRSDVVITDRSYFSTLAYQGSSLGRADLARLTRLQRGASVAPDLVLLLDLPPTAALGRVGRRRDRRGPLERRATLGRVAAMYRRLARRHRWTVLDAARSRSELARTACDRVLRSLGTRTRTGKGNRYPPPSER